MNRLPDETSPYLLQHAKASLATPTRRGRAGFAGMAVLASLATPTRRGRAGFAGMAVLGGLR
jgi:hypothetical protein